MLPTNTASQTFEIIHEDDHILVCRKMAGVPVQTAKPGQQDMVSLLKNYRGRKGEVPEIYVVHRLDQPVEGLMVFAKTGQAASALSKQIQQKRVDKYYRAIVEGIPEPAQGMLEDYLLRDGKSNTSKVVAEGTKGAKKAVLRYRVVKSRPDASQEQETDIRRVEPRAGVKKPEPEIHPAPRISTGQSGPSVNQPESERPASLLEIRLETGRHHQIRVQMAHAGYPLVGDKKYNPNCQREYLPIGLCSVRLAFDHPVGGGWMEFTIDPVGPAFQRF